MIEFPAETPSPRIFAMIDQSDAHSPAKPGTEARTERFLVLALLGLVLIVVLGVYLTIPYKLSEADSQTALEPNSTERAI